MFPVVVSTTESVFWARSVTKASLPSELNDTDDAPAPTGIVRVTFRVVRSTDATWLVG
jgi:hypothetical protein